MRRIILIILLLLFAIGDAHAATVSDEFARADNTDVGTSWDTPPAFSPCQILSQRVTVGAGSTCAETWNANSFTDNQWAQVTIITFVSTTSGQASVLLRADTGGASTFYRIVARRGDATASTKIQKFITGTITELATENAITWGAGDVLYAEVSGTTITAKRNGATIFITTDSDITSGRIGFNVVDDDGPSSSEVDSFTGGDLTAAGTRRKVGPMAFQ